MFIFKVFKLFITRRHQFQKLKILFVIFVSMDFNHYIIDNDTYRVLTTAVHFVM